MQVCTVYKYGILISLDDVIDVLIYVKYNRCKNNIFKGFHDKSYEFYCKYINFMIVKVLTATASTSSRHVYVEQTFDV